MVMRSTRHTVATVIAIAAITYASYASATGVPLTISPSAHDLQASSDRIIMAFDDFFSAVDILITQGPSAFLDVAKQWLITLANAIPNHVSI
ncbi:hypothetical protein [Burkholderia aenigmatica]|uniref:hypothetical protein n=1 Tax=Burkholderia aenigmatica TaxID=2015348 RepID=UPI0026536E22|nr:hypothetical protein [Burkholderia aenigmatica]MDN7880117.1 hypothetical protein [Burkholderia aenigmatica]